MPGKCLTNVTLKTISVVILAFCESVFTVKLVFLFWLRSQTSSFVPLLWSIDGLHAEVRDVEKESCYSFI